MIVCLLFLFAAVAAAAPSVRTDLGEYSRTVRAAAVKTLSESFHQGETVIGGTVTFVGHGFCFLQSGADGIKVRLGGARPKPGDEVEVRGKPTLEGGRVSFVGSRWRKVGEGALPEPRRVGMDELVVASSKNGVNATRVVVAGRVIGPLETGFAVNVGGVPISVMSERTPPDLADSETTHPKVIVRGVCELVLDQSTLFSNGEDVLGVKMHLADAADVTIVPDVAYLARKHENWTRTVSALAIGILSLVLLAILYAFVRQRQRLFRTRTLMAERKRMADDIHDTVEQHLVGAKMLVALGRAKEAQDVLVRAKAELRDIVWGLKNDDMMRLSPSEMLRRLAADENQRGIVRVDTLLSGLPERMDAAAMRDLSLIVRETIGNAIKHGNAKKIAMSSEALAGGGWRLSVANDGKQFDPATAQGVAEGHFGLEGMRERSRRIGVALTIAPRKQGMVLILEKGVK